MIDIEALASAVAATVNSAARSVNVERVGNLGIGLTGLPGRIEDPARLAEALRAHIDVGTIVIASDALTGHLGSLAMGSGTVVAAGTGAIALGTDLDRIWNQADGWGLLFGDDGGGAWVGMCGLRAAFRALDGRDHGSPALLDRLRRKWGDPRGLVSRSYVGRLPASFLADFAPSVARAARAGDIVAASIWRQAGTRLAQTAVAASAGLGPVFSWSGRLFAVGGLLVDPFKEEVLRMVPSAAFVTPSGTSLDGAVTLAVAQGAGRLRAREPYVYVFRGDFDIRNRGA